MVKENPRQTIQFKRLYEIYQCWNKDDVLVGNKDEWMTNLNQALTLASEVGQGVKILCGSARGKSVKVVRLADYFDINGDNYPIVSFLPSRCRPAVMYKLITVIDPEFEELIRKTAPMFSSYRELIPLVSNKVISEEERLVSLRTLFTALILAEMEGLCGEWRIRLAELSIFYPNGDKDNEERAGQSGKAKWVYKRFGDDRVTASLIGSYRIGFMRRKHSYTLLGFNEEEKVACNKLIAIFEDAKMLAKANLGLSRYYDDGRTDARLLKTTSGMRITPAIMSSIERITFPENCGEAYREIGAKKAMKYLREYFSKEE